MDETVDWVHSLHLVAGAGDPVMKSGIGIYIFAAGKDMNPHEAFYSADGDFLIVPQHGVLDIQTELGNILVRPNEICVIPRGIRYLVTLPSGPVRGYILELYQGHFTLPELGPIGSNCLAKFEISRLQSRLLTKTQRMSTHSSRNSTGISSPLHRTIRLSMS